MLAFTLLLFAATGRELQKLQAPADDFTGIAISPDGKRSASSGLDNLVKLWVLSPVVAK